MMADGRRVVAVSVLGLLALAGPAAAREPAADILQAPGARGGLCLIVGARDARTAIALARGGRNLVHCLAPEAAVHAIRQAVVAEKLHGTVSVSSLPAGAATLPFPDNLVNLLIVEDPAGLGEPELRRVVVPNGMTFTRSGEGYKGLCKGPAAAMDDWPQRRHGPSRNPVSDDALVKPPTALRWIHGPGHGAPGGTALSGGGLNFYPKEAVRDAFNGLPVRPNGHNLTLAAIDGRVLYAPDDDGVLKAFDAAGGKVLREYPQARGINEMVYADGQLFYANDAGLGAIDAKTGAMLWTNTQLKAVVAFLVGGGRLFVQTKDQSLVALDLKTGQPVWTAADKLRGLPTGPTGGGLILYHEGLVLARLGPSLYRAYAAADGKTLWDYTRASIGFQPLVAGGLLWIGYTGEVDGLDPATGARKRRAPATSLQCATGGSATQDYLLGGLPMGFTETATGAHHETLVARNGCRLDPAVLVGNGLTYAYPKSCSCYAQLRGYVAFAADPAVAGAPARLHKGPAFDAAGGLAADPDPAAWPTYRQNNARGAILHRGNAPTLAKLWEVQAEDQAPPAWLEADWTKNPFTAGPLTAPVSAGGTVLVGLRDSHRVLALDTATGRPRWTYTAGARVYIPPTIAGKLCLIGAADGAVHCLDMTDGRLAWRYQGAPADKRIVAYGQLESHWPVLGGVLVQGGKVFFTAGRHSRLEHGMIATALDLPTGRLLWETPAPPPSGPKGAATSNASCVADVPVADGNVVKLGHSQYWLADAATGQPVSPDRAKTVRFLRAPKTGIIDLSWCKPGGLGRHESPQQVGPFDPNQARRADIIQGRLVIFDPSGAVALSDRGPARLTRTDPAGARQWSVDLPARLTGLALIAAGGQVFVAGAFEGKGLILSLSLADGKELARAPLPAAPVAEGMASAEGRLFLSLRDGRVVCMGS